MRCHKVKKRIIFMFKNDDENFFNWAHIWTHASLQKKWMRSRAAIKISIALSASVRIFFSTYYSSVLSIRNTSDFTSRCYRVTLFQIWFKITFRDGATIIYVLFKLEINVFLKHASAERGSDPRELCLEKWEYFLIEGPLGVSKVASMKS